MDASRLSSSLALNISGEFGLRQVLSVSFCLLYMPCRMSGCSLSFGFICAVPAHWHFGVLGRSFQLKSVMPGGCRQKSSVTSSNRFEALLTANFDPCEPVEPRSNHASARSAGKTAPSAIAPTFAPARVKREWKTIADSAPKEASTSHVHLLRKSMSSVTILQYNVLAQVCNSFLQLTLWLFAN